jgi:DNA-binding MarR family transcriptional regulator
MTELLRVSRQMARDCAWLRVRQASRALTAIYDARLQPAGIVTSQLSVLVALAALGEREIGIGDLARELAVDRTTLTRNIRPLEKAGLIRVARSPSDARTRLVLLTLTGARAVEAAFPLWEQAQRSVRETLGAVGVDELFARLGEVAELGAAGARRRARAGRG